MQDKLNMLEQENEDRTFVAMWVDHNSAAVQLYDTVDEGHTDAVACRKVPVPTTEERLE